MSVALPVIVASSLLLGGLSAVAQSASGNTEAAAGVVAGQLPAYRGRVALFTLTPRGDIDGLILADGTEVKTPPHLSAEVDRAVKRGDPVTILGLKAATLPLVQAVSITDDASGRTVTDRGPGPHPPAADDDAAGHPVPRRVQGCVRLVLHGARGDVNGVLFEDGTVVRLPPSDATRLGAILVPGASLVVDGTARAWATGTMVEAFAVGATADRMATVAPDRAGEDRRR